ncbi:lipopolysaccharide biosynthesis glycosyltransferase [Erwinia toletana]|uniref:Lipopolysaccharide biosynthesis glycosyltransferase n=1 Tax=Winslowiella toletana TaxID=92490 RepID=A0ABS4P3Y7_9GAMM|nr:glycosyltransferase family 8 protein [Winslowiella toletana]MBP2167355.1 lipopolysaccharide biosynthesis glycosyltransferase [Winslowiella toletana]
MSAWITLLTQPEYLTGVQTLHQSLRQSKTAYPLVVMVTENIAPAICAQLKADGCEVIAVAPLNPHPDLTHHYASAQFAEVWTKLRAWQLTDYQRLVFLDADMLVVQNMDELMTLELPENGIAACHACRCNPNSIASYPKSWVPENCFYTWQDRQQPAPAQLDAYFNAGFLVLTPDAEVFSALESRIAAIDDLSRYQFSEQDLLNEHFHGRWKGLPYIYNALKTLSVQHAATWDMAQVKNIHYILAKPWQRDWQQPAAQRDRYYDLDVLWQQIASQVDHK